MCHNSVLENEQIDKCIENGMPHKIIKTIKYTMRKRAANEEEKQQEQKLEKQQQQNITDLLTEDKRNIQDLHILSKMKETTPTKTSFISRCPFGHDRLPSSAPAPFTTSPSPAPFSTSTNTNTTTSPATRNSSSNSNFEFPNSLNERFHHQITQLSTNFSKVGGSGNADDTNNSVSNNNSSSIRNISGGHYDDKVPEVEKVYNDDILAKSTQLTKQFTLNMQQAIRRLQSSKIYTLLTKTAQPAHIIAICIVSFVLVTVWPELIDGTTTSSSSAKQSQQQYHQHHLPPEQLLETTTSTRHHSQDMPAVRKNDMLALIAYLGAFSTHFGAQIWMTFVSGLSLYFSLPRHMFGQCQQILFPKYFAMNAVLSITMLILYVKFFLNTWTLAKGIQLGSLALTGAIELLVRLYLAPPLLRLMHEKYKIEGTIGSGKEIGSLVQGDLVQCPHYQRIHKAFRRIHMTVAIGNIITMVASCLHLYFIAGQLQISIA